MTHREARPSATPSAIVSPFPKLASPVPPDGPSRLRTTPCKAPLLARRRQDDPSLGLAPIGSESRCIAFAKFLGYVAKVERLGFIIGIFGVALALIAFDQDKFRNVKELLFYGGVGLACICGLMLLWPVIKAWRQNVIQRNGPIYLPVFYKALESQGLVAGKDATQNFMQSIVYMVRHGELTLLGRLHGDQLVTIPPSHFDDYSLASLPSWETGLLIFKTVRGADVLALLEGEGSYDRLHVPNSAVESIPRILEYMSRPPKSAAVEEEVPSAPPADEDDS